MTTHSPHKNIHVLVTGGAGYVGTHTCVELLNSGYDVTVLDNLSNSSLDNLRCVAKITGKPFAFCKADLRNREDVEKELSKLNKVDVVFHVAGMKSIKESVENPLLYYKNNVVGTMNLIEVMEKINCRNIVFSSSAAVYGNAESPVSEDSPTNPTNTYGHTKLHIEHILEDVARCKDWRVVILRYFNPIGVHKSGLIGESSNGNVPVNLVPYLSRVAFGNLSHFNLYGTDYETKDGTCIRDYIHVVDLAKGHLAALDRVRQLSEKSVEVFNLGTGKGFSVLEVINEFAKISDKNIKVKQSSRRPGDVSTMYASVEKANRVLEWHAECDLNKALTDMWNWQNQNK